MQNNNLFINTPANAGVVRNSGSVDVNNSNKRSSYSFTLSRVGMERELDDFLKSKTAKGTGLTISNYVRDLINRDYKNQLDVRSSFVLHDNASDDMRSIIVDTKINTDNIISILSNVSPTGVVNNASNMFNSNVNNDVNSLLMEIYKHVSNVNNSNSTVGDYNIGNVLQIISDKLNLLDAIEKRISGANSFGQSDGNMLDKIDNMYKHIELQNKKINSLEEKLEDGFESVIDLLKKANFNNVCYDEEDECDTNSSYDVSAYLKNDIGDDDE